MKGQESPTVQIQNLYSTPSSVDSKTTLPHASPRFLTYTFLFGFLRFHCFWSCLQVSSLVFFLLAFTWLVRSHSSVHPPLTLAHLGDNQRALKLFKQWRFLVGSCSFRYFYAFSHQGLPLLRIFTKREWFLMIIFFSYLDMNLRIIGFVYCFNQF